MTVRCTILSVIIMGPLVAAVPAVAQSQYPDWSGQWTDLDVSRWDPSRPRNLGQKAPLVPEYQAMLDAAMADRAKGGRGNTPTISCGHTGMPRAMLVYEAMEFSVHPNITYLMFDFVDPLRRIYTDGRAWPSPLAPTWMGYSIGRWEGSRANGQFDTLVIETRGFKGPRILDGSGIPLHADNQTVVKERIALDEKNADVLRNEITLVDSAFTQPWTVTRSYKRNRNSVWGEYSCGENNEHVFIQNEAYFLSADGYLMPTRKDQPPPDTRYFNAPEK
jgi:hypothetical protein